MERTSLDPTGWEARLRRGTKTDGKTGKVSHPVVWSLFVNGDPVSYVESPKDIAYVVHFYKTNDRMPTNDELSKLLQPRKARRKSAAPPVVAPPPLVAPPPVVEEADSEGDEEEQDTDEEGAGDGGDGGDALPSVENAHEELKAAVEKLGVIADAVFKELADTQDQVACWRKRAEDAEAKLAAAGSSPAPGQKRKVEDLEKENKKLKATSKALEKKLAAEQALVKALQGSEDSE